MSYTTHGILGATYNIDAGGATAITKMVGDDAEITFPDVEGPLNPNGGKYHGTQYAEATLYFLDATAYAAILAEWQTDDEMDFVITLSDSATLTYTQVLPVECKRMPIQGKVEGRADRFMLKLTGPATVFAFG